MNSYSRKLLKRTARKRFRCFCSLGSVLGLLFCASFSAAAAEAGETFGSPEDAVTALVAAAGTQDTNELRVIFGPQASELENPDRIQGAEEHSSFARALGEGTKIVHESDSRCVLEIGEGHWPFPIPVVKKDGRWLFDTAAGKEEILNRRIGKNELATLQVVRAYVEAQREYASHDEDGDEILEYAQRLASSPGKHDGLYWPGEPGAEPSPLGPFVAYAQGGGKAAEEDLPGGPFHGYYFKILTRQGPHALGGKYDYVINRKMIAGFALVAWPARYGDTGIMTFVVNQQGRVYQKDLGTKTSKAVGEMKAYDPDSSWQVSRE